MDKLSGVAWILIILAWCQKKYQSSEGEIAIDPIKQKKKTKDVSRGVNRKTRNNKRGRGVGLGSKHRTHWKGKVRTKGGKFLNTRVGRETEHRLQGNVDIRGTNGKPGKKNRAFHCKRGAHKNTGEVGVPARKSR